MGSSIHISQKSKVRSHRKKTEQEITLVSAKYVHDFIIQLTFSSDSLMHKTFKDFLPLFQQYVKGENMKYFSLSNFKKFVVKNGNIYWGKDEDVIFPTNMLFDLNKSKKGEEEILYII